MDQLKIAKENQVLRRQIAAFDRDFKRHQFVGRQILEVRRKWGNMLFKQVNDAIKLMRDAIKHCETCRNEKDLSKACARCKAFHEFINKTKPKKSPNAK